MNTNTIVAKKGTGTAALAAGYPPVERLLAQLDLASLELLRRARHAKNAEAHFPGIHKARFKVSEIRIEHPQEYFRQRGEMSFSSFGMDDDSMIRNGTEALGIMEDLALRQMRGIVCGRRPSRTELVTIVNCILFPHALRAGNKALAVNQVMERVLKILDVIHDRLIRRPKILESISGLQQFVDKFGESMRKSPTPLTEPALGTLQGHITTSIQRKLKSKGELAFVVECLMTSPLCSQAEAAELIYWILTAVYLEEIKLWEGVEECRKEKVLEFPFKHRVRKGGRTVQRTDGSFENVSGRAKMVFVESENSRIVPASRMKEAGECAVTVVRNGRGNVGIFLKRELGLDGYPLYAMIQAQKRLSLGHDPKDIDFAELLKSRECHESVEDEGWRFRLRDGLIENGLTVTDVPGTTLGRKTLVYLTRCAFHWGSVCKWLLERGIEVPRKKGAPEKPEMVIREDENGLEPVAIEAEIVQGTEDLEKVLEAAKPAA